ncbi:hypothetical protein [Moraxella catarrhalis]|uniref:Uncharacterized protein n=1 Tax=Moraxella catarrhalis TaxID=480 RepID=A0A198UFP4_MORCA|nr:hypothetical protein [Moraxella catarrhalis]OAU95154.1 hypothetical protein AO384_1688 [Moraxella catarrhalis]OAU99212.1 hypothetical protein AO383_0282 [Moraxella catarrhalis]OAV03893.1 hypothetical protein AO385_0279 [Moraxella catarrhalis]
MANFSPSINFAKRWLATPSEARTAIYQELDDIIDLLDSELLVKDFRFQHEDFDAAVAQGMQKNSNSASANRLIHTIETTSLKDDDAKVLESPNVDELEARLIQSMSGQIDEFLGEHMAQLSEDLRAWVKVAVRHELANYQSEEPTSQE